MKTFAAIAVLVICVPSIAGAQNCQTSDPFPYTSPYTSIEACPIDIQDWLDRANGCAHIEGEYHDDMDEEREKDLNTAFYEMQCDYVACDFEDLFAKYEGDIAYTGVLVDYEKVIYGSNGVFICNQEKELPPEERIGDTYLED